MGSGGSMAPCTASRESLRRLFFQQFCPMAEKNGNKIFFCSRGYELVFEKIFCKDWNFQVWRNTWDAKTLWERWAHRLEIHLLHSYLLSDTRAVRCDLCQMWCGRIGKHCQMWALCSDHCGRRFWFRPKATFYPCGIAFQNTPSYLRPWCTLAFDKIKYSHTL